MLDNFWLFSNSQEYNEPKVFNVIYYTYGLHNAPATVDVAFVNDIQSVQMTEIQDMRELESWSSTLETTLLAGWGNFLECSYRTDNFQRCKGLSRIARRWLHIRQQGSSSLPGKGVSDKELVTMVKKFALNASRDLISMTVLK
jgi:hypothetical protein